MFISNWFLTLVSKQFNMEIIIFGSFVIGFIVVFNKWYWENWISIFKRINLEPYFTPYTKTTSKWVKALKIRARSIEFSKEKLRVDIYNFGCSHGFLDMTLKGHAREEKVSTLNFIKIKKFVPQRILSSKWENNLYNRKKIFILVNHILHMDLKFKIHKKLLKLNNQN